jgi:hypothetical protein
MARVQVQASRVIWAVSQFLSQLQRIEKGDYSRDQVAQEDLIMCRRVQRNQAVLDDDANGELARQARGLLLLEKTKARRSDTA